VERSSELTGEDDFRLTDYTLDMYRSLFNLRCNETTSRKYQIRVRLGIAVLEVEPSKKNCSGCDGYLTEE